MPPLLPGHYLNGFPQYHGGERSSNNCKKFTTLNVCLPRKHKCLPPSLSFTGHTFNIQTQKLFWTQDQVYEWFTAPHLAVIENEIQDVLHNYLCQLNHQPPPLKDIFHTSLGPQHDLVMIPTPSAISKPKSTGIIIKEEKPDYIDFLFQDSQDPWEDFLPLSQHLQQFP